MPANKPHPIDLYVGSRIRLKRKERGLTMAALADHLTFSKSDLQKLETATKKLTPALLAEIADALGTPITWFFEGRPSTDEPYVEDTDDFAAFIAKPEAMEVIRIWSQLTGETPPRAL